MQDQRTEGETLWRGGEALALQKLGDRFTIQLSSFAVSLLSRLAQQLAAYAITIKSLRLMPFVQLAELQVAADHLETAMQIARSDQAIAFASHVYQMEKSPEALLYLTDQITLQFAEDVSADRMGQISAALGLQVVKLVPGVVKGFVFRLKPGAAANPLKLTQRLMLYPEVWLAEPNIVTEMQPFQPPEAGGDLPIDLEAIGSMTQGDRSTVIAVMGGAIALSLSHTDFSHTDFSHEGKMVAPFRLRQSLPHLSRLLADAVAEKTAVAPPNRFSLAPQCALMPIEMDGFLDDQSIEEMFEWASQQGADLILCDWRAKANYFPLSLRQRMAIARAATQGRAGKGCVIVFAANRMPTAETSSATLNRLNGFALHPDVISMAVEHSTSDISPGAIVAEVAALMLSVNPDLTAAEVKQIFRETAHVTANIPESARPMDVGCEQVNALRAVQMAQRQVRRSLVAQWIERQNLQAIEIPDAQANRSQSIFSPIQVEGTLDSVLDIEISLSLEHSFASDLQIDLAAPNGETVLLQNRSLGRLGSLSKTYSLETTPLLKRLFYQAAGGEWRLQLSDRVPSDTGRLVSWTLRLGV